MKIIYMALGLIVAPSLFSAALSGFISAPNTLSFSEIAVSLDYESTGRASLEIAPVMDDGGFSFENVPQGGVAVLSVHSGESILYSKEIPFPRDGGALLIDLATAGSNGLKSSISATKAAAGPVNHASDISLAQIDQRSVRVSHMFSNTTQLTNGNLIALVGKGRNAAITGQKLKWERVGQMGAKWSATKQASGDSLSYRNRASDGIVTYWNISTLASSEAAAEAFRRLGLKAGRVHVEAPAVESAPLESAIGAYAVYGSAVHVVAIKDRYIIQVVFEGLQKPKNELKNAESIYSELAMSL